MTAATIPSHAPVTDEHRDRFVETLARKMAQSQGADPDRLMVPASQPAVVNGQLAYPATAAPKGAVPLWTFYQDGAELIIDLAISLGWRPLDG